MSTVIASNLLRIQPYWTLLVLPCIYSLQVHRRTLYDDRRGVGEPLNEPGVDGKGLIVRGHHLVVLDNIENSTIYHRMLGEILMMREYPMFVSDSGDPSDYIQKYMTNVRLNMLF